MGKYLRKEEYNIITGGRKTEISELTGRINTSKLNQIKGLFTANTEIKIKVKNDSKCTPYRFIKGVVIGKNDYFVSVKTKTAIEGINYVEFLQGRAKIILN